MSFERRKRVTALSLRVRKYQTARKATAGSVVSVFPMLKMLKRCALATQKMGFLLQVYFCQEAGDALYFFKNINTDIKVFLWLVNKTVYKVGFDPELHSNQKVFKVGITGV